MPNNPLAIGTGGNTVELPFNLALFVRGIGVSRADRITNLIGNPSGFYTYSGTAQVPTDPTGFVEWQVLIIARENGSAALDDWTTIIILNMKSKAMYLGGYDVQTSGLAPWQRVYTSTSLVAGTATQSGNGSTISFTIAHGLGVKPAGFTLMAGSDDADNTNIRKVVSDATNLTISYKVAPPTGTNNLTWTWTARL